MAKVVVDTNYLIEQDDLEDLIKQYEIIIPMVVLEELDNLNHTTTDQNKKYKIRNAIRLIESNIDKIMIDTKLYMESKNDNIIIESCISNDAMLITYDVAMKIKAKVRGLECVEVNNKKEDYKGYKEIILDEFELANFYECMIDKWGMLINEYLIIKDLEGNIVDCKKYTKHGFKDISKKTLKSVLFGDKIKAKDVYQEIAFDSLVNDKFTVISGFAGSGKSLLSLVYCTWALQNSKYDKLIIAFNPTKTRGASEMGFYSGNVQEKGLQQFIGNMLNSKFGDPMVVHGLLNQGKLQLVPISDIRGMEITDNQILYITEAQNLSIDLCKTCIQRVSENAKVIFEGDIAAQVDNKLFEGNNNGLKRAIEVFRGHSMFGYVDLPHIYRSKIADIAEKM
jgi:PhoH-like ATPase